MPLKEYSREDLPHDKWNGLIGDSLFLSPDFLSLWELLGGRAVFIVEERGADFVSGIAGVRFGRRRLGRIKFIPDWLYGRPAFKGDADSEEKRKFIEELHHYLKRRKYLRADIYNPSVDFPSNLFKCRQMATHIIRFEEKEYCPPNPMVATDIRHGQKEGGKVILLEDEKYLGQFFALAETTASRHGKRNRYKNEFLRKLWELSRKDKRIICPMVLSGDNIAAVHIYLVEGSQVLYWQSYFEKRYNNLRPNYLILDYMIKYSQRMGLREINLGGSPARAEQLVKFKEAWGGKPVLYNYYTYYSGPGKMLYWWREA